MRALGITAVGLLAVGVLVAAGEQSAQAAAASVSVPQGSGVGPLQAGTMLGATDPSTPVDVSVILKARNLAQLQSKVASGWTGGYLSTSQFAAQYGQPLSVVDGIESYLGGFGLSTSAYDDGLDISVNGTAAQVQNAFGVSLHNYRVSEPAASGTGPSRTATVFGSMTDPRVPQQYGNDILTVLGLSNYSSHVSNAVARRAAPVVKPAIKHPGDSIPAGMLAPQDFINDYGLNTLEADGSKGQGETLGIVTLATFDPSVPLTFWNSYLGLSESPNRLTEVQIDGGAPGPSLAAGTDETDLDVEQSGAIASKADVRVYEAPNTDPGFADAFFAAASDNVVDTVSTSWGESESYLQYSIATGAETAAYEAAFDEAFLEFGAQGQSDFASAGDQGAYDATGDLGSTNLTVDTPASSPYITAAGGTTLPGVQTYPVFDSNNNLVGTESVNISRERTWSWDYLFPLYKAFGLPSEQSVATPSNGFLGGTGGGYSALEPRPSYQSDETANQFRQYFAPVDYQHLAHGLNLPFGLAFDPTPALLPENDTSGRALPDVSTNADPQTGYAVYDPNLFSGDFAQYGGTSFVSPQLNASTAVIDSYVGGRVGLWNPSVYRFANGPYSPFTPLNDPSTYSGGRYLWSTDLDGHNKALQGAFSNNNLYYASNPGTTWNPASGLGTPNLTQLAYDFDS